MSGPERVRLPSALAEPLQQLDAAGHAAYLVGRSVGELWRGARPLEFELATSAAPSELLALFLHAVPLTARRLLLPTGAGPVDLLSGSRSEIREDLARRDFTRNALALDARGALLDPFEGRADLLAGRLRGVGDSVARLAEDPLRALRAARLVATEGLEIDPELLAALPSAARPLLRCPAVALREELKALLLGPHAGRGLAVLRRGGIEAALAPDVGEDAAAVVDALPAELELRLAGWLRGTRAVRCLRRLRLPREQVLRVERLLQHHPIEAEAQAPKRLLRRPPELVERLFALRRAEIAARGEPDGVRLALDHLRDAIDQARRGAQGGVELALGGRAVMEALGCRPGPEVGRALAWLRKSVEADPSCNAPEGLRALLEAWGRTELEDER